VERTGLEGNEVERTGLDWGGMDGKGPERKGRVLQVEIMSKPEV